MDFPGPESTWPHAEGELSRRIAAFDWENTAIGAISNWPKALRNAVDLLLRSPVPMVLLWGAHGVMIYNDAYAVFAGGRHPGLLGSKVLEGWPEVADFNRDVLATGLDGRTLTFHDQHLILHRDGKPDDVWLDLYYSPVVGEGQTPAGVLAIVVETTERVRAEQDREAAHRARRQSEERLAFALEAGGGVGTWDWDIAADRIFANAQFAHFFSVEPSQAAAGAPLSEFAKGIHPEDRIWVGREIERAVQTAGDFAHEYRLLQTDGAVKWIFARGRAYHDDAGRPVRFPGVVFDITERKQIEEVLRESEARFRTVFAQAPVGMALTTHRGEILDANAAFLKLIGRSLEEIRSQTTASVTHPQDIALTREFLEALWSGVASRLTIEKRYFHRDGHIVWARASGAVRYDNEGRPEQVIVMVEDITEQKRAEARLLVQYSVSKSLAEATSVDQVPARVLRDIASNLEWARGACWLLDAEKPELDTQRVWKTSDEDVEPTLALESIRTGEPRWVSHLDTAAVAFPITADARNAMGAFQFALDMAQPADPELLRTLAAVGQQVGQFIQRRRAEEQLRQQVQLSVLGADVGKALTQGNTLRETLQFCSEALVRHLDAAFARIWTLNELTQELELQASAGLYTHIDGGHARVPVGRFKIGLIAAERQPHLSNHVASDPRVSDQAVGAAGRYGGLRRVSIDCGRSPRWCGCSFRASPTGRRNAPGYWIGGQQYVRRHPEETCRTGTGSC